MGHIYVVTPKVMPGNYEDYLAAYEKYSAVYGEKTVIFYQGGMFYELYETLYPETGKGKTTAFEVADFLGLKLALHKGEGIGGLDGYVAGIPDYVVHKWATRLTDIGWVVVVMDQVKNKAGTKVISHVVKRILTPGSHVEAIGKRDCFMSFLCMTKGREFGAPPGLSVVSLDLATGHLFVFETQATGTEEAWTSNEIVQFMELYPPREVLWSISGPASFCERITEARLRNILGVAPNVHFHKREPLTGAWDKPLFREDYLRDKCQIKNLLPVHTAMYLTRGSNTETALLSLLNALDDLWPSHKLGALLVRPWVPGTQMVLGENALVQLHMVVPGQEGSQDVYSIFDKCCTPMGTRGLRERLLKPSARADVIIKNLDTVEYWYGKSDEYKDSTAKLLRSMSDLARLYRKIQQGSVVGTDIISLNTSLTAALRVAENESQVERAEEIRHITEQIFAVFSREKSFDASEDKSILVPGICPDIDVIEGHIRQQHAKISTWISNFVSSTITVNADIFKPDFREKSLVIKGPRAALQTISSANRCPKNAKIVIQKTGSYIESHELDQIFATLTRLRESLRSLQATALIEQGVVLANRLLDAWIRVVDWITEVDVNLNLARIAQAMGYVRPEIAMGTDGTVGIGGLRHPLLELQDRRTPYIQHDVQIGSGASDGWLLYGLNASGKSSLMRAVGLAVLLAQAGSFVPARSMVLTPFSSLHTRIVNTDNLWMGLSSFAVEMAELRDIFREAGPRSLVLGDELCSGTETTSATALVAAGLRGLLNRGAKFLFATHLHGLAQIPEISQNANIKILHLHVEHDPVTDKLVYHRTLRPGHGSALYGIEVARAMRIPADVLEDAIRFRKQIAGEADLTTSVGSSWNSQVVRRECSRCHVVDSGALEVHHIRPRVQADTNGRLPDGSDVHAAANLVVLCAKCHDETHEGLVTLQPMIQTSDGPEASVGTPTVSTILTSRSSKWNDDEMATIQEVLSKYSHLSTPQLAGYLLTQYGIKIHSSTLRKMRA